MRFVKSTSLLAAVTLISACGGSSSGSSAFNATGPITVANLNEAGQSVFEIDGLFEDDVISNVVGPAELQAQGSGQFSGFLFAGAEGADDGLVGRATLNATFTGAGSLTGEVTDLAFVEDAFVETTIEGDDDDVFTPIPSDAAITQLAGSLTLSGGGITSTPTTSVIDVKVSGDVAIPAGLIEDGATGIEDFDVNGDLLGFVTTTDQFVGAGELDAVSETYDFNLDAVLLAE